MIDLWSQDIISFFNLLIRGFKIFKYKKKKKRNL